MRKILALLLLLGSPFATTFNITAGTCLNDSVSNDTYCAENATILYNITNVTNMTVVQCNATNLTMIANSTQTINNATVTCLENTSINRTVYVHDVVNVTQNVTVCPTTNTTMWANSTQTINNQTITCLTNYSAIPTNYCYENIYKNPLGYGESILSSKCNISVIAPGNNSIACQTCQVCPVCAACQCEACPTVQNTTCPAPPACPDYSDETILLASLKNETLAQTKSIDELTLQMAAKDEMLRSYKDTLNTIDSAVDRKVDAKTGNVNDMYGYALIAGLCCTVFFVWKSRQPTVTPISGIGAAITKERLDELRKQRGGENYGGGNTDDAGTVEKSQPRDNQIHSPEV